MSSIINTTNTGDIVFTNGSIAFVDEREAVRQHCRTRLRMIRGDSLLRDDAGLDLDLLGSGVPLDSIEGELRTIILGTPGIVSIDEATLAPDEDDPRVVTYTFAATIDLANRRDRIVISDTLRVGSSGSAGETQALTET